MKLHDVDVATQIWFLLVMVILVRLFIKLIGLVNFFRLLVLGNIHKVLSKKIRICVALSLNLSIAYATVVI